jgi:hypothetical protein
MESCKYATSLQTDGVSLKSKLGSNRAGVSVPSPGGQKQIQFPKYCFLHFTIPDDGQSPKKKNSDS